MRWMTFEVTMNHDAPPIRRRCAVLALPILLFAASCGAPRAGDNPPEAVFTGLSTVVPGTTILFDSSLSKDVKGLIGSRTFDFGDGSPAVVMFSPQAEHTFEDADNYDVTLTIKDDLGNTDSVTHTVIVVEGWMGCDVSVDCASTGSHCVDRECVIAPPDVAITLD